MSGVQEGVEPELRGCGRSAVSSDSKLVCEIVLANEIRRGWIVALDIREERLGRLILAF